jgi:hypothetical protein
MLKNGYLRIVFNIENVFSRSTGNAVNVEESITTVALNKRTHQPPFSEFDNSLLCQKFNSPADPKSTSANS